MNTTRIAGTLTLLGLFAACEPAGTPQTPEAPGATPASDPSSKPGPAEGAATPAVAAAPAEAGKSAAPADSSPVETLARDLLKSGGRRIGWSAGKKRFVVPVDFNSGNGRGLDLRFYDDEGQQREIMRVCQPGECEEQLDEMIKQLMPKLVARLGSEGFEAVYSVGWPSGRDEVEVSALNGKLHYQKGRLSVVHDKKSTPLRSLGGKTPHADELAAVYPVMSAKILGAVAAGDFFVFKLP